MPIPLFILIPGAGADPRVYGATIAALRGIGREGIAPTLPLQDQNATPSDLADAVAAAVPPDAQPIVVRIRLERLPALWFLRACPWHS